MPKHLTTAPLVAMLAVATLAHADDTDASTTLTPTDVRDSVVASFDEPPEAYEQISPHLVANLDFNAEPDVTKSGSGPDPKTAANEVAEHTSLATQLSNPIANLISMPIQFNWDTGSGVDDDTDRITVNVQPVIPFDLSDDWLLISRTIIPIIYAEGPATGIDDEFGIGDTLQSLFFSPKSNPGGWILGGGPAILLPTGTDDLFRSKQLSIGPTFVALKQIPIKDTEMVLTIGMLANHVWKVSGSDDNPAINATFLQPFVNLGLGKGATITLNTESTYNWQNSEWSVPINASFRQVLKFGKQPVQLEFGGRYYAESVPNGPEWGLRFTFTLLFPK